ncbi:TetR family transcriptional regulator, partial [Mycobacterium tuberculosis]|nr:TetR family transcriptional regulator [Mycobacterium tuberculosis]
YLFGRRRVNPRDPAQLSEVELPEVVARATAYMPDLRGKYVYDFGMEVLIAGLEARLVARADRDVR